MSGVRVEYGVVSAAAVRLRDVASVADHRTVVERAHGDVTAGSGELARWSAEGAEVFAGQWRQALLAVGQECALLAGNLHSAAITYEQTEAEVARWLGGTGLLP